MAEVGNHPTTPANDTTRDITDNTQSGLGLTFDGSTLLSSGETATPNHIGFYVDSVTGNRNVYAAVYLAASPDSLVCQQSSALSVNSTGWKTINLASGTLNYGSTYYCVICADAPVGTITISGDNANTFTNMHWDYYFNWWSGSAWSSTGDPNPGAKTDTWNIYLDYTVSGGGTITEPVPSSNLILTPGTPKQTMLQIHKVPAHGT